MKTYYDILQVSEAAAPEVIRAAWVTLQRQYHPDLAVPNVSKQEQDAICKLVNEAYRVIGDPQRRAAYDAELKQKRRPVEMPMGFDPSYPDPYAAPMQFGQELFTEAAFLASAAFAKHLLDGVPPEFRTIIEKALNRRKAG